MLKIFTIALFALGVSAQSLPPKDVPGALNPDVTQANIKKTVCVANWTKTVRPPASYTNKLKAQQMAELGLKGDPHLWEEDHRVPLSVGGCPTCASNLWPEQWSGPQGAHAKDAIEDRVHRAICNGSLTLKQGQAIFLGNWWNEIKAYALK